MFQINDLVPTSQSRKEHIKLMTHRKKEIMKIKEKNNKTKQNDKGKSMKPHLSSLRRF